MGNRDLSWDLIEGIEGGLYAPEQWEAFRIYQQELDARDPIMINQAANAVMGMENHGLGLPLGVADLEKIRIDISKYFYPFFYHLGKFFYYFLGISMIFVAIKLVLGTIIRCLIAYQVKNIVFNLIIFIKFVYF